ncbi:potassium-transporting ATPase subunit KdpC [Nesterenkonia halotolerans]|uniref:potassium-transporting ATPase subunit KdpC n=1 Tax=Nesterenkonia halotolerans TaxID=225325 RepID=UPI003EE45036
MNLSLRRGMRSLSVAARMLAAFTLVLGLGYTLVMTGIGQTVFAASADGSLLRDEEDRVIGSRLLGQAFLDDQGAALPEYFQPRPSAADYDGAASGGSNWGPENEEFIESVSARADDIQALEGVPTDEIPADALTASSSGLDPHISPDYAAVQAARVAEQRGVSLSDVTSLIQEHTAGPDLGFLGNERVNVLELNLALDANTTGDQEDE